MPEQEALIKLLGVTVTDKLMDEVSPESLWMEMMMFADDTVVSGENRKQVGQHRGGLPGQRSTPSSQGQRKAELRSNQLCGYHAQRRKTFVCSKITLFRLLVTVVTNHFQCCFL